MDRSPRASRGWGLRRCRAAARRKHRSASGCWTCPPSAPGPSTLCVAISRLRHCLEIVFQRQGRRDRRAGAETERKYPAPRFSAFSAPLALKRFPRPLGFQLRRAMLLRLCALAFMRTWFQRESTNLRSATQAARQVCLVSQYKRPFSLQLPLDQGVRAK